MPWGRLNDKANGDQKLLALTDAGWRMWGCGLIYCQAHLTDGFIPEHAIHTFGVRAGNKAKIAAELCSVLVPGKGPLWEKVEGGYRVHHYLDWNDARDKVLGSRSAARDRMAKFRSGSGDGSRARSREQTREQADDLAGCSREPRGTSSTTYHVPRTKIKKQSATSADDDPERNVSIITALISKELIPLGVTDSDLVEATKDACAQRRIAYSGSVVRRAVDSALFLARKPSVAVV